MTQVVHSLNGKKLWISFRAEDGSEVYMVPKRFSLLFEREMLDRAEALGKTLKQIRMKPPTNSNYYKIV